METLVYCPMKPIVDPSSGRGIGPHRECDTAKACKVRALCTERVSLTGLGWLVATEEVS